MHAWKWLDTSQCVFGSETACRLVKPRAMLRPTQHEKRSTCTPPRHSDRLQHHGWTAAAAAAEAAGG